MVRKISKWGSLAVAFGWPALVAELLPRAYWPEMMVVAVINGLVLGIWALR